MPFRETADIGDGIIQDLAVHRRAGIPVRFILFARLRRFFIGFGLVACQRNRRSSTQVRRRRHGRDMAGQQDVGAGTVCPRAGRRDVGGNRHSRIQD